MGPKSQLEKDVDELFMTTPEPEEEKEEQEESPKEQEAES